MLEGLAFEGTWRRYQQLALDAFERDRAAGRRRTHIVAPPGSGKTLLGVELMRRVGRRALVLAPNGAIQMQWPRAVRRFGCGPALAGTEPGFAIACLSYQSLAQLDDPEARGRSLRLDPGDRRKLASNWDVVCVAPDLVRGTADYERFVRRHLHLFAPADDGEIEAGPSHVHPSSARSLRHRRSALPRSTGTCWRARRPAPRRASAGGSARPTAGRSCAPSSRDRATRRVRWRRTRPSRASGRRSASACRSRPAGPAPSPPPPPPSRPGRRRCSPVLVGEADNPRYLVGRPLAEPGVGAATLLGRVLARRPPFPERLHPVPRDFARHKRRAEAFAQAWRRRMGPGRLVFTQRSDAGRRARAAAAGEDGGYETLVRDVWV